MPIVIGIERRLADDEERRRQAGHGQVALARRARGAAQADADADDRGRRAERGGLAGQEAFGDVHVSSSAAAAPTTNVTGGRQRRGQVGERAAQDALLLGGSRR